MENKRLKKIQNFKMLYIVYFMLSLVSVVATVVWISLLYILGWKDFVTLFELFMVGILVVTTFYLRMNAFHYQRLYLEVQNKGIKTKKVKEGSKLGKKR